VRVNHVDFPLASGLIQRKTQMRCQAILMKAPALSERSESKGESKGVEGSAPLERIRHSVGAEPASLIPAGDGDGLPGTSGALMTPAQRRLT